MEPASTLATVALAAAALLPTRPYIEVRLRNWENRTSQAVNFFDVRKGAKLRNLHQAPKICGCQFILKKTVMAI